MALRHRPHSKVGRRPMVAASDRQPPNRPPDSMPPKTAAAIRPDSQLLPPVAPRRMSFRNPSSLSRYDKHRISAASAALANPRARYIRWYDSLDRSHISDRTLAEAGAGRGLGGEEGWW